MNQPIENHKCAVFIFVFMVVYNFFIVNNFGFCKIDDITYAYHLVDYTLGFCTKLLPGAIYNAIFPTTNPDVVNIYFNILYHIFLVGVSFVLEKFINTFENEKKVSAFIVTMFFITGPATFAIHAKEFGMLDTYWLFFFLLFILFLRNKYLKWLIPAIFVLSILIHISSLMSFIPFFLLFIFYEASTNKNSSKSYYAILVISAIVTIVTFLYFLLFEEKNLALSLDEYYAFMDKRNTSDSEVFNTYYEYALYKVDFTQETGTFFSDKILINGSGPIVNLINSVWSQIQITLYTYTGVIEYILVTVQEIILLIPLLRHIYKYISKKAKDAKSDKPQYLALKFSLIGFPLLFIASALFSPDLTRWFGNTFICLAAFGIYVIYKTKDTELFSNPDKYTNLRIIIYFMFYSLNIVNPYY